MTPPRRMDERCRALTLEISRYLDRDLSPARARALAAHLDDCACCADFAASLRRAILACRSAGFGRLPARQRARARRRVAELLASS